MEIARCRQKEKSVLPGTFDDKGDPARKLTPEGAKSNYTGVKQAYNSDSQAPWCTAP
jgi:hypothetical protein